MTRQANPYHVPHRLTEVRFTLQLSHPDVEVPVIVGLAQGSGETKRTSLWTESNIWTGDELAQGNVVADWVHHIALAALQDRPNTSERLLFSLTGGLGVQDPLF